MHISKRGYTHTQRSRRPDSLLLCTEARHLPSKASREIALALSGQLSYCQDHLRGFVEVTSSSASPGGFTMGHVKIEWVCIWPTVFLALKLVTLEGWAVWHKSLESKLHEILASSFCWQEAVHQTERLPCICRLCFGGLCFLVGYSWARTASRTKSTIKLGPTFAYPIRIPIWYMDHKPSKGHLVLRDLVEVSHGQRHLAVHYTSQTSWCACSLLESRAPDHPVCPSCHQE